MQTAVAERVVHQAQEVPDLLTRQSPKGLRVVRITSDTALASSHIYMESHVFTPDSRRFVFQRLAPADNPGENRTQRTYWLCDLDDNFALRQLTDEPDAVAPSVSPDGKWMYYFVSQPTAGKPGTSLKRVSLETFERETVLTITQKLPLPAPYSGASAYPTLLYILSSISADGHRVAVGAFFGDGRKADAPSGVLVCDVPSAKAWIALAGSDYINTHPQYCQHVDPQTGAASRDLLIQHNHTGATDAQGNRTTLAAKPGQADVHVISDDGSDFRDIPCGRSDHEMVHGHQCWRGRDTSVVVGTDHMDDTGYRDYRPLVLATPVLGDMLGEHRGLHNPLADCPGVRTDITREIERPAFGHFAFDPTGTRFVGDWRYLDQPANTTKLLIGTLSQQEAPVLRVSYLLHVKSTYTNNQATHPHPFLSPDGRRAFFNSDFGLGVPQVWMVEGFEFP